MKKDRTQQLAKAYKKRFKVLAYNPTDDDFGIEIFVEHLKFTRDNLIIRNLTNLEQEPIKTEIALLNTTIAEFNAYQGAFTSEQKLFHWNTFCDFLKLNKKELLGIDDSI